VEYTLLSDIHSLAILPGDGIGPEIMAEALKILRVFEQKFNKQFNLTEAAIGGAGVDLAGVPLPAETLRLAHSADAVLMGSVGDFKYDQLPPDIRPEQGLLQIRKAMDLFANLRPVCGFEGAVHGSPLKADRIAGVNILVVRELTGGIYFGKPRGREGTGQQEKAFDTMVYSVQEIERVARVAFEAAMTRRKILTSVDKANVLASSQLWREVVDRVAKAYPAVTVNHMYVDNAAMQLVVNPKTFDVILTENLFGDILSDEASVLVGSLGMLPSASLSAVNSQGKRPALYEPAHGSAPQFKGQNRVNPVAQILSLQMMLEYSFGYHQQAAQISEAIQSVLSAGYRTFDIMEEGCTLCSTSELGDRIAKAFLQLPVPVVC
jgi:3-isopropylmalate dehydrogenase